MFIRILSLWLLISLPAYAAEGAAEGLSVYDVFNGISLVGVVILVMVTRFVIRLLSMTFTVAIVAAGIGMTLLWSQYGGGQLPAISPWLDPYLSPWLANL